MGILTTLILLPLAGAFLILFIPSGNIAWIRRVALAATAAVLGVAGALVYGFDPALPHLQFIEKSPWIASFNIWYFLGVDGLSLGLVFLTALLGLLACMASFTIERRQKEYFIFYLILMAGMLGTFLAQDMFLFYSFWEIVLVPMYFLIGIWGGPRREYAAIKLFLYTLAGSVLMLVGILVLYFNAAPHTFDMLELARASRGFDLSLQIFLFLIFFLAFAVKVPIFPFHTWLPDAHVEAPTPISVLLAGVLLKMGGYGFLRISFPFFPEAARYFAWPLMVLGVINIVYGACVAMAQEDFKKMIAYSSVSHMGFVLVGLASLNLTGWNGAILEMFNHGIITGGMFLLVGVLYDRAHTRELSRFGGIAAPMPVYAFFLTVFSLASLGLPGLSGFVGEFLSLLGAFAVDPALTMIAATGLILTAGYFLYIIQRVLLGPLNPEAIPYPEINRREIFTLVPLLGITLVVGVFPELILRFQETAVTALMAIIQLR